MQEWRKHFIHMTKLENERLHNVVHNNQYSYTTYSSNRINERKISEISVLRAIKYGDIIEFHFKDNDCRVLLRSREMDNYKATCVVVSLNRGVIVTVYQNQYDDNHYTLHRELYNSKVDLLKYIN